MSECGDICAADPVSDPPRQPRQECDVLRRTGDSRDDTDRCTAEWAAVCRWRSLAVRRRRSPRVRVRTYPAGYRPPVIARALIASARRGPATPPGADCAG